MEDVQTDVSVSGEGQAPFPSPILKNFTPPLHRIKRKLRRVEAGKENYGNGVVSADATRRKVQFRLEEMPIIF